MENAIWANLAEVLHPVETAVARDCRIRSGDPFDLARVELAPPDRYLYPGLTLLTANLFGYAGPQVLALATAVQYIYLATYVHSGTASPGGLPILVGDFFYTRFFRHLSRTQALPLLNPLASVIVQVHEAAVAEGQLGGRDNAGGGGREPAAPAPATGQSCGGLLAREAGRLAGLLARAPEKDVATAAELGYCLGMSWVHVRRNCLQLAEQCRRRCHELLLLLPQVKETVVLGRLADALSWASPDQA